MEKLKTVIFDLDGTLIDSAPHIHHVSNAVLAEASLPPQSLEQISGFIGNGVRKLIERFMKAAHATDYDLDAMSARFTEIYLEDPKSHTLIYPHVLQCLHQLKTQNYQIGICTNKLEGLSVVLLQELGIGQYIDALIGGDSTPKMKPAAEPIWEVMNRLGAQSEDTIYIGDSETDAKASKAAGLRFGFYEGGYCHVDPASLHADFRFDDFQNLPAALLECFNKSRPKAL